MVREVLEKCGPDGKIVRLVFFGDSRDNADYMSRRQEVCRQVRLCFGRQCPAFSFVAQKPLTADLLMEVHFADASFEGEILYGEYRDLPYVILRNRNYSALLAGGVCGKETAAPVRTQAEEAMACMEVVLQAEGFAVGDIVRQWNYLERITEFDGDCQRYQAFNEVRSRFYASAVWFGGYPAATGIGMRRGGVVIDFIAVKAKSEGCRLIPLNNVWQVAAHAYSRQVLQGRLSDDREQVTPKFERAKVWDTGTDGIVYISGTAAIRGEQSLSGADVLQQTKITLENIGFLISESNLRTKGMTGHGEVEMLRVYLKHPEDRDVVSGYVSRHFPGIPVLYVSADICRQELLVEVEGIFNFYLSVRTN